MQIKKELYVKYIGTFKSINQSWAGKRISFLKDIPVKISLDLFNFLMSQMPENFQAVQNYDPPIVVEKPKLEVVKVEVIEPVKLDESIVPILESATDVDKPYVDPMYDDNDEGIEEDDYIKKKSVN